VRALLRRANGGDDDDGDDDDRLAYLDLELDVTACRARRGDRPLELTRTEQRLLELLLRNAEQVLPRDMIYERVWGHDISATSNSLDVYVGYLRRKTEEGGEPRLIHTVRGVGFRLTS
jgi:two-component system response regulator MprA